MTLLTTNESFGKHYSLHSLNTERGHKFKVFGVVEVNNSFTKILSQLVFNQLTTFCIDIENLKLLTAFMFPSPVIDLTWEGKKELSLPSNQ